MEGDVMVPRAFFQGIVPISSPQALSFGLGTRPPTEVGARALRFRRPARSDVARLRTFIRPKGAHQ
jgi:hypothetical protein